MHVRAHKLLYLPACLPACLPSCLSTYLSVYLPTYLSINLPSANIKKPKKHTRHSSHRHSSHSSVRNVSLDSHLRFATEMWMYVCLRGITVVPLWGCLSMASLAGLLLHGPQQPQSPRPTAGLTRSIDPWPRKGGRMVKAGNRTSANGCQSGLAPLPNSRVAI